MPALIKIYFNFIVVFSRLELNESIGTDKNIVFLFSFTVVGVTNVVCVRRKFVFGRHSYTFYSVSFIQVNWFGFHRRWKNVSTT